METREERESYVANGERDVLGGERKINKISKRNYSIDICTVSYLRRYCSGVSKFLTFDTPHKAFGTSDENALIAQK